MEAILVMPHQCRVEQDNHFPQPPYAVPDAPHDMAGLLGCQCTLFSHISFTTNQNSQIPFCRAALQPLIPQSVQTSRLNLSQVQDPAPAFVKFHLVGYYPALQFAKSSLQGLLASRESTVPLYLVLSANLLRIPSSPAYKSFMKTLKRTGENGACGTPLGTGCQPGIAPFSVSL